MDRLHAMEVVSRVIETGSFSAAARDLRLGQPAVSKLVAGLEEFLGVRLLVRSTRRLHPTQAGQAYYEHARQAMAAAEEAEVAARGLGKGLEGTLRVCAAVTFARLHIAPKLGEFLEQHPKLKLELVMDDRSIDLLEENIDIALRMGNLADSSLTARKIAEGPRLVVASPAYLARHGTPQTPADLLAHQSVSYTHAATGEEWRFRQGSASTSVQVPSRLAFSAAEGLREAAIAGLGIAIVSRWMVAPELASGALVPVLEGWSLPAIDLWAVTPAGRLPSTKARSFVAWFEKGFAG